MTVVDALAAYAAGDRSRAASLASGSVLGEELARYLAGSGTSSVYDQPNAFTAFIRGGGNVELYRRLSAALTSAYDTLQPRALLDVGCGDGLALVPALAQASFAPGRIDLVEPSAALLNQVRTRVPGAHCWNATAEDFLARDDRRWDLVQSTFALQSIAPASRASVLSMLAARTSTLVLAEFDVPASDDLSSLAARYERGIAEYGSDASLVAQGFLLPILLGRISGDQQTNWEHPASVWASELREAGFTSVTVEPLADYWWSPAVLITATNA